MWSVRIRALQEEWEGRRERANDALLTEIILNPLSAQKTMLSGVMGPMPAWGPHRGQDLVQAPGWRPLCAPGGLWAEGALPSWPLPQDQEGRSCHTWRRAVQNRCVAPGFSHRVWETWVCSRGNTGEGITVGVTKWQRYGGASGAQGMWPTGGHFCVQVFLSCPSKASDQISHDLDDGLNKGLEQRQAIRFKKGTAF